MSGMCLCALNLQHPCQEFEVSTVMDGQTFLVSRMLTHDALMMLSGWIPVDGIIFCQL